MDEQQQTWDVALGIVGSKRWAYVRMIFPAPISRALTEKGLWRATLTITDEGILVKPYPAPRETRPATRKTAELPWMREEE